MMRFYTISLSAILSFLIPFILLPLVAFGANEVNVGFDTDIGGFTYSMSGKVDQIVTDGETVTFTLPADNGYSLTFTSTDRREITYTETVGWDVTKTCDSDKSEVTFKNPKVEKSVTITPKTSVCSSGSSSSPGGSGGGGGSSSTPTSTSTSTSTPTQTSTSTPSSTSPKSPSSPSSPTAKTPLISAVFTKSLSRGISGSDVRRLQQLLNSDPDTEVAKSGVGSKGNETNYFGSLTAAAVQKFQIKYKVVSSKSDPGYGYVGPKTRAKLNEIFGAKKITSPTPPDKKAVPPPPSAPAPKAVFKKGLAKGMFNADVKRLQILLNSNADTRLALSGPGSPGNETNYFGRITEKGVQKFQVKYGVAKPGDPGYGYVGPKTRAKLGEVFGGKKIMSPSPTSPPPPTPVKDNKAEKKIQDSLKAAQEQLNKLLEQLKALQKKQ